MSVVCLEPRKEKESEAHWRKRVQQFAAQVKRNEAQLLEIRQAIRKRFGREGED